MKIKYELQEPNLIVKVPKELDHHFAEILRTEVETLIQVYHIRKLVFDFAETEFMDSSGIGVLIGRCRTLGVCNGVVYAKNLNQRVEKIFRASGLGKMICIISEESTK